MRILAAVAVAATMMAGATAANATTVFASGEGWCNLSSCNNTDTSFINNTYASDADGFRDWFAFDIPDLAILDATISIWNHSANFTEENTAFFALHLSEGFSFTGLGAGAGLGGVNVASADTGQDHYVTFALNAAGLAALNGARGTRTVLGGAVEGASGYHQIFGYTGGEPIAYLTLNTGNGGAVPEPAAWALMIGGFFGAGSMVRRRKMVTA